MGRLDLLSGRQEALEARKSHRIWIPEAGPGSPSTLTSIASHEKDSKRFSSLLLFWPDSPVPSSPPSKPSTPKVKHIPIDISKYYAADSQVTHDDPGSPSVGNISPRSRRHIPIIIPDFAQPIAPAPQFSQNNAQLPPVEANRAGPSTESSRLLPVLSSQNHTKSRVDLYPTATGDNMNQSHTSLHSLGQGGDTQPGSTQQPVSAGATATVSPMINQQNSAPTNLSVLVCNVHRTSGDEPHALVGAATTILGDKLYVFGGRVHSRTKPKLTSDLYELNLIRRKWTKLDTTGDIPPPRYFHSVCALGDNKLVCYGGMSPVSREQAGATSSTPQTALEPQPEVAVMSDIHILDVTKREWTRIQSSDAPQGRYAHCATILPSAGVFTSASAPYSAIHHNPSSSDPHSGTLGVELDGTSGAEMVVVGGQDSANNYIEQISVFNLRSLKWTSTTAWDRKCGAYKSMVAPLTGIPVDSIGRGPITPEGSQDGTDRPDEGTSMLIYSNYNFLDVKLELQIRLPNGRLTERAISGSVSPPGLRFPNGGIIDNHFVVSGTYLTSTKHEYALWALDLRTLTWGRIDTNGTVFSQGSWNRGVLWNRRNTFVILGHRKRNLVDDYNHRRINFSHVCFVELEAFGLYDNPRKKAPTSGYISMSSPAVPASLQASLTSQSAGGRPYTQAAERLGEAALSLYELADMELVAIGGERIPCNSLMLSRRWGPFFNQLLQSSVPSHDNNSISDAATLRPAPSQKSRNSSITITPSIGSGSIQSNVTTLAGSQSDAGQEIIRSASVATTRALEPTNPVTVPASTRPRSLYLPHTAQTIQLMLHYLYTSSLPPVGGPLCNPHILCSLLQMARPYQIDGLLEATVERLHEVLDGRNAAAVFNAAAMAAGGGRGLGQGTGGTLETLERRERQSLYNGEEVAPMKGLSTKTAGLRINTNVNGVGRSARDKAASQDSASTTTSVSTTTDFTDTESSTQGESGGPRSKRPKEEREAWTGDVSAVIGLQKRGLRGLMEGRRLRERAQTLNSSVDG